MYGLHASVYILTGVLVQPHAPGVRVRPEDLMSYCVRRVARTIISESFESERRPPERTNQSPSGQS